MLALESVSEWLLFNAISAISWREQVNFQWGDDDIRFTDRVKPKTTELTFVASPLNTQH
jgi:hypothetical protein